MNDQTMGTHFQQINGLVVDESLIETLLRAEECYWGVQPYSNEGNLNEFAYWIESRIEILDSQIVYPDTTWDKTIKKTMRDPFPLVTGEGSTHRNCAIAAFAAKYFDQSSLLFRLIRHDFLYRHPGPLGSKKMLKTGVFCCEKSCNIQYQRALALLDRDLYLLQEEAFLKGLRSKRKENRRWAIYPFYYTVLCLEDIASDATKDELHEIAKITNFGLMDRYHASDRHSRSRLLALEKLEGYR